MAPTLQTFDAVKAQRLFSWHQQQKTLFLSLSLSLFPHLPALNNLRGALSVVMKNLLQPNAIITPQFVHTAIHRGR